MERGGEGEGRKGKKRERERERERGDDRERGTTSTTVPVLSAPCGPYALLHATLMSMYYVRVVAR
jgi:hypothetical protein